MYTVSAMVHSAPATGASRCIDTTCFWGVLHVVSQLERKVDATLHDMGIASYLPLRRERRVYRQGGRRILEKPLFDCYVFYGFIDDNQKAAAVSVDGVLEKLDVHYSQQAYLVKQLQDIAAMLELNPFLSVVKLAPGDRVRVTRGPLAGIAGTLIRRKHEDVLVVGLHLLGQGVEAQIDLADCERIT